MHSYNYSQHFDLFGYLPSYHIFNHWVGNNIQYILNNNSHLKFYIKHRIDRPELFQYALLGTPAGHFLAAHSLSFSLQLVLFLLRQSQNSTQPFVVDNNTLINAGQFIENLIAQ